jgi:hypothetical protein
MRQTLSLASLLLVAAAVAHGADQALPQPYQVDENLANFMMGKTDELVHPYIVGGEVGI